MKLKFTKMHGCGNDYVYVNCFEETIEDPNQTAKVISDRHFGIGSDGMICICPSEKADFRMAMYNSDGSEGAMCGNGIRCVAKYVYDHGMTDKERITVETKSGIKTLDLKITDGKVSEVVVDMGSPITKPELIPVLPQGNEEIVLDEPIEIAGKEYRMTSVSMGNPHTVVYVDDVKAVEIEEVGPLFEHHERFPDRVNTEFIHVISPTELDMRVWERGAGETLACGTGTCAAVYASILNKKTEDEVLVHLLGGDLCIRYDREKNTIFMTGPATTVFEGEIDL